MFEKPFFVILTNRCNLSCTHCYNKLDEFKSIQRKERDFLSRKRLQFLFDQLVTQGYQKGYFSGGEPLMRPDTPEIIADARERGLKTALFTNGHLFTTELIKRLAGAGLHEIRISLNELALIHTRWQYQKTLQHQIRWIPDLLAAGISVGIIYIISKTNLKYVIETLNRVRVMGASMKVQPLYHPDHLVEFDRFSPNQIDARDWENLIEKILRMGSETDFETQTKSEVYGSLWEITRYLRLIKNILVLGIRPNFCPTGPILVLDSDGYFHPCLFRYDLVCGHILDDELVRKIGSVIDEYENLSRAFCFKKECLSAYR